MQDISCNYLGLSLKNPILVGSCGFTKTEEKLEAVEAAGAGAVVLKSLFEEVLAKNSFDIEWNTHPEAYDYIISKSELYYGAKDYCDLISNTKKKIDIPVIANINCVTPTWWSEFAKQLEASGADAIELNVFPKITGIETKGNAVEEIYFEILQSVKEKVNIPIAMKIGKNFSSLPNFANELSNRGLDGLVMFNRFTEPDININELKYDTTFTFSRSEELSQPLRWTAVLYNKIQSDICASTGIKNHEDVIRLLLAGSNSVQLASVLYEKGFGVINEMIVGLKKWMKEKNYEKLSDFRGKMSFENSSNPTKLLRTQFMEKISEIE